MCVLFINTVFGEKEKDTHYYVLQYIILYLRRLTQNSLRLSVRFIASKKFHSSYTTRYFLPSHPRPKFFE